MTKIGVMIGSTPIEFETQQVAVDTETPWGLASAKPHLVDLAGQQLYLLHRHGEAQQLSPHQVNYRANVWLLQQLGVEAIIGTHTVGSIDPSLDVGQIVLPHQIVDYTWGRDHTYDDQRRHVEFSHPYDDALRNKLVAAYAQMDGVEHRIVSQGVYGCTQGPRLETVAEIERMQRDGCDLVGMTGMPEAGLARELDLPYISVCVIVNPAAGVGDAVIDMDDLFAASRSGARLIAQLLAIFVNL